MNQENKIVITVMIIFINNVDNENINENEDSNTSNIYCNYH